MTLRRLAAVLVAALFLTGATRAAAPDTGSLVGTVSNGQKPLPGATITLTGPGTSFVQVTDRNGQFRFPALGPGTYTIAVDFGGSTSAVFTNIVVASGRRKDVALMVGIPAAESAATDLEKIPTARDPWAMLNQTPGVLVDRINVGGNEAGRPSVYIGPGAQPGQGVWFLDGVNITDMSDRGRSPLYFDFDSAEEMKITTGGSDSTIATPGVTLNVVTKRGTNEWRGAGRYVLSDDAFRSGFKWDGQPADAVAPSRNRIVDVNDYGAEIGGPVIKDRLWIWGAYGTQALDLLTQPQDGPVPETGSYQSTFGNFNFLPAQNNRLSGTVHFGRSGLPDGGAYARPFDATWNEEGSLNFFTIEDTHVFGSRFFMTGMYSRVDGGFQFEPQNTAEPAYFENGLPARSYSQFDTDRSANELRADGGYFFDAGGLSHQLKFGGGYRAFSEKFDVRWPGNQFTFVDSQFPIVVLPPIFQGTVKTSYTSGYAQDTIDLGSLTADFGIRWDRQIGRNARSAALANPDQPGLVPGGESGGNDPGFSWNSIMPRLGLTYALGPSRKTLLRASYSQFGDQLGTDLIKKSNTTAAVPQDGGAAAQYLDANGNRRLDANENTGSFIIVNGVRTDNPQFYESFTRYAPGLRAPVTRELLFGVSTDVNPSWNVGLSYRHRGYSNALDQLGLVRESNGTVRAQQFADFVLGPPATGFDFDDQPFNVPTYQLRDDLEFVNGVDVRNGDRSATYQGVSVEFTKRLANRWMLRGFVNFGDWDADVPESSRTDPNNYLEFGDVDAEPVAPQSGADAKSGVYINSRWSYSVQGLCQVAPDQPWGFNLSANVYGRQGYLGPASATVTGTDFAVREIVVSDASRRYDDVFVTDLSVNKRFGFDRIDVTVGVDAFNLFNSQAVLQQDRDATSPAHREVTETISPRIFRLGARISFR